MPAAPPPLPGHYLRHVAAQLRVAGVDVDAWLAAHGLSTTLIETPTLSLDLARFEALLLDAIARSAEPALGLFVGERLLAATHGVVGTAVERSTTLRDALALFERYTPLRLPLLSIRVEATPRDLRVRFDETWPLGALQRPLLEAAVLSVRNVVAAIADGATHGGSVAFPFAAPAHAALARELFACPVRYGRDWAGFTLAPDALDRPLRGADPAGFLAAARICQQALDALDGDAGLASRVRRLLLERRGVAPSLRVVARACGLSPRTLHRRLIEQGTSYRALVDAVRHGLARAHLHAGDASVDEIAHALGYTDVANFRRAFRRWEGAPPSALRGAPTVRARHASAQTARHRPRA